MMMTQSISIHTATPGDAPELTLFSRKTFIDAFAQLNNEKDFYDYVAKAFTQDRILEELHNPDCSFFIARLNNQWTGYAKLEKSLPPDCVNGHPAIELSRLYSHQDYLGQGIGPALVEACIAHAVKNGFKSMWLGSWKDNHRGNAFYRKMQFEVAGTKTFVLGSDVQEDHVFVRLIG